LIAGIIPPVESKRWQARSRAYQDYYAKIRPLFQPGESIINFNVPEFDSLRNQLANLGDGGQQDRRQHRC
jgi:hypothetical protein